MLPERKGEKKIVNCMHFTDDWERWDGELASPLHAFYSYLICSFDNVFLRKIFIESLGCIMYN